MSEALSRGITATLKAGTGFDSPWLVFYGETAAEVANRIGEAQATGLFAIVGNAAEQFRAAALVGGQLGGQPVQAPAAAQQQYQQGQYQQPPQQQQPYPQQQPQQAPQGQQGPPPGMTAPTCPHGTKRYINGKFGPFWGCPANQHDPSRCKPQNIK